MFHLWRSEKRLQAKLEAYVEQVTRSLGSLKEAFPACLDGAFARRDDLANPVHALESVADDMRRELELELYAGRLLPESRADLLALIEALDRISNSAENIVEFFSLQELDVPAPLRADLLAFLLKSLEACACMAETVGALLEALERVRDMAAEVDALESRCDALERRLLRRVFDLDLERAHKLHLRDLVQAIGMLSDRAEEVADMVLRIVVKRRF
jgi:hypothetical protein